MVAESRHAARAGHLKSHDRGRSWAGRADRVWLGRAHRHPGQKYGGDSAAGRFDCGRAGGALDGNHADRRHSFNARVSRAGSREPADPVLEQYQVTMRRFFIAAALLTAPVAPTAMLAQEDARAERVMALVRSAVVAALPFQASDAFGSLPADGKSSDPWMIKPHQPGDQTIEILANPLNEEYQRRAAKAMAQIEQSIEAAQRRAELQYERAIAEAKRTRRSQDVDGVTLSDEGVAGARIDAESHVTIDVSFNEAVAAGVSISTTPSNVYRGDDGIERFREAESTVSIGARQPSSTTPGVSSLVIRLRGNETLIGDLLRKSDWASLVELLK